MDKQTSPAIDAPRRNELEGAVLMLLFFLPQAFHNTPFKNAAKANTIPINTRKNPITYFVLLESNGESRCARFLRDAKRNIVPTNIMARITNLKIIIQRFREYLFFAIF
jgi:hypothetical protein